MINKIMNENEIRTEMYKALHEVFNTEEIIGFEFNLMRKAFLKGLELGKKIKKENHKE